MSKLIHLIFPVILGIAGGVSLSGDSPCETGYPFDSFDPAQDPAQYSTFTEFLSYYSYYDYEYKIRDIEQTQSHTYYWEQEIVLECGPLVSTMVDTEGEYATFEFFYPGPPSVYEKMWHFHSNDGGWNWSGWSVPPGLVPPQSSWINIHFIGYHNWTETIIESTPTRLVKQYVFSLEDNSVPGGHKIVDSVVIYRKELN